MKQIIVITTLLCLMTSSALAQKQPKPERVFHLKITPMLAPRPAMKYRLLPSALDTVSGDGAQLYMIGATQAPTEDAFYNQIDSWLGMDITALPRQQIEERIGTTPVGYVFKNFELAARYEQCAWITHYKTQGFEALLPYLRGMRDGAKIIALKARLQMADGDYAAALHTLQTGMATSRHLTPQSVLIQQL